ncbi:MAG: Hsp20/alpha crystallin family protein [bacterium]|nr:Hsp20/alpha crystallin family protein [bacterium]
MSMHNRFNRMCDKDFYGTGENETEEAMPTWYPATDIYETKDDYVFKMEVPGLTKDDVKIEVHENTLSIKGERKEEKEVKQEDYHRIENRSGSFSRSFRLPDNADAQKINATIKNGMLDLRVAKAEEKKPKTIPIQFN